MFLIMYRSLDFFQFWNTF